MAPRKSIIFRQFTRESTTNRSRTTSSPRPVSLLTNHSITIVSLYKKLVPKQQLVLNLLHHLGLSLLAYIITNHQLLNQTHYFLIKVSLLNTDRGIPRCYFQTSINLLKNNPQSTIQSQSDQKYNKHNLRTLFTVLSNTIIVLLLSGKQIKTQNGKIILQLTLNIAKNKHQFSTSFFLGGVTCQTKCRDAGWRTSIKVF